MHYYGKLFQQYFVDSYAKMEHFRLDFLRYQQQQLRVELYSGPTDALYRDFPGENGDVGRMISRRAILPSTHVGSPRYMHQLYRDAMAIVTAHGKPDSSLRSPATRIGQRSGELFLGNGQRSPDRPDVIVRVFHEKLKMIMADITDNGVLGRVKSWMYVIDFQKRGLPHTHIVVILENDLKPRKPSDYDNIVLAELPDPQRYPKARETVAKLMVHGPCGHFNPNAPCMVNGTCSKGFPKSFAEETTVDASGFPRYRRRNNGDTLEARVNNTVYQVDNEWIAPYNLMLSVKCNAHINVEVPRRSSTSTSTSTRARSLRKWLWDKALDWKATTKRITMR